jgi:hypothetical protein
MSAASIFAGRQISLQIRTEELPPNRRFSCVGRNDLANLNNIAAILFFLLFLDNLSRHAEGQGWKGFWPCSGRLEVVVLFGMLSLVAQFVYWSRIVSGLNQEHA